MEIDSYYEVLFLLMFGDVSQAGNVNGYSLTKNWENDCEGLLVQLEHFLVKLGQSISVIERSLIDLDSLSDLCNLIKLVIIESPLKLLIL